MESFTILFLFLFPSIPLSHRLPIDHRTHPSPHPFLLAPCVRIPSSLFPRLGTPRLQACRTRQWQEKSSAERPKICPEKPGGLALVGMCEILIVAFYMPRPFFFLSFLFFFFFLFSRSCSSSLISVSFVSLAIKKHVKLEYGYCYHQPAVNPHCLISCMETPVLSPSPPGPASSCISTLRRRRTLSIPGHSLVPFSAV
ncbi:hypothetical protein B0I35DRAFT_420455 [Stachybotrys elegans]|uniref:Uncharacterized protein n=1 Tax=Stachybotrys elegans TaxID=80388 RepID=A0A8K0T347_9HYPO|nr:hypothetical protein B0I35DRAFT_420455 [Stachybotrys elegans]